MISTVEEFQQIVEGDYGITNLKAYGDYKENKWKEKVTKSEIERMSPDNINSCSFWEYIEKNPELAKDAIGFGVTKDQDIDTVNFKNEALAFEMGTLNHVWKYRQYDGLPILDIGAGYGMLKGFVARNTKFKYYGVDVYPKVEGVLTVAPDGYTLPDEVLSVKFGMVVSTNVFQHLSVNQRRGYYAQIEKVLLEGGVFSVSNMYSIPSRKTGFRCLDDDKAYCCHYGQYTEIQTMEEQMEDLSKHFNVIYVGQRIFDQVVVFHCVKKPSQS